MRNCRIYGEKQRHAAHLRRFEDLGVPGLLLRSHLTPILLSLPLQLLANHLAVLKGNDVDHPRNLAKSFSGE